MDVETYPVCIHVSESKEDEELLRVQNFLRQYEEKMSETAAETVMMVEKNINLPENQEMVTTICGLGFQLLDD